MNIDRSHSNSLAFLDIRKAFYVIDHSILSRKLGKYGICNNELIFFYLISQSVDSFAVLTISAKLYNWLTQVCCTGSSLDHYCLFFIPWGHFNRKKITSFGQLASAEMFGKFHCGLRKSPSDFWLPLLEQPTKFVLNG